jgi:putative phage-type endonuclease
MTLTETKRSLFTEGLDFPDVVADTLGMSRDDWLELRAQGLGGSDAAWVLGRSPYKSTYSGWAEKAGLVPEPDLSDNEAVEWGNVLEPVVADRFASLYGFEVVNLPVMLAHPTYPHMLANVDRFIVEDGRITGLLEVKTAGLRQADYWQGDNVPVHYALQVQHYLAVTGLDYGYLVVLIGGQQMKAYRLDRDEATIAELIEAECDMWERIINCDAPDVDGSDSTIDTLKNRWTPDPDSVVELNGADVLPLIRALAEAKDAKDEIDSLVKGLQAQLMAALGEHEVGQVDGTTVVTWKSQTRTSLDTKAIKAEHPEIVEAYSKTSTTRTLLPKYTVASGVTA